MRRHSFHHAATSAQQHQTDPRAQNRCRPHPGQPSGPKTLHEKYRIPPELVQEIVLSGHGQVLADRSPRVADVAEVQLVLHLAEVRYVLDMLVQGRKGRNATRLSDGLQLVFHLTQVRHVLDLRIGSPKYRGWPIAR